MKKYLQIFLPFLSILISVMFLLIVFTSIKPVNAFAETYDILLNELKPVKLSAGEVKSFYFTSNDNRYYVIETTGYYGTKLRVSNLQNGEVVDTVSGIGDNARIYFRAEATKQIKIDVKFYNSSYSGSTTLQVRRQTISMFGYVDKNNNSTISDLATPYNKFNSIFNAIKYENVSANFALSNDERGITALNSEVLFFSGHGNEDGSGVAFYNNGSYAGSISNNMSINMDRTKVAMWSACCSASDNNSMNMSIAEASVRVAGAKSAVGFKKTVSFSSAKTFTNKFFTKLAEGSSVNNAAKKGAASIIWAWDNVKKYSVFGRGEITVTSVTKDSSTMFSLNKNNLSDYFKLQRDLSEGYLETELSQNEFRYYEIINGYESSNYIDVLKENNKIIDSEDHRNEYTQVLEINSDYLNFSAAESINLEISRYNLMQENDEHIVYYNFDGVMTPIKITFCTYVDKSGNNLLEAECINLYNGEKVNYSDIIF